MQAPEKMRFLLALGLLGLLACALAAASPADDRDAAEMVEGGDDMLMDSTDAALAAGNRKLLAGYFGSYHPTYYKKPHYKRPHYKKPHYKKAYHYKKPHYKKPHYKKRHYKKGSYYG